MGVSKTHCWDLLPSDYVKDDNFFELDNWYNATLYKDTKIKDSYKCGIHENNDLIESNYKDAYETINAVIDVDSLIRSYILEEIMKDIDVIKKEYIDIYNKYIKSSFA